MLRSFSKFSKKNLLMTKTHLTKMIWHQYLNDVTKIFRLHISYQHRRSGYNVAQSVFGHFEFKSNERAIFVWVRVQFSPCPYPSYIHVKSCDFYRVLAEPSSKKFASLLFNHSSKYLKYCISIDFGDKYQNWDERLRIA